MMVIAKMTAVTVDQVLLSYGSGLDGATPNIRVNALDHLIVGFSGTGWTADIVVRSALSQVSLRVRCVTTGANAS